MFGKWTNLANNFDELMALAKNENFRKFLAHPKVQALMEDESFKEAVTEKNWFKLMTSRQFAEVLRDPEVREALESLKQEQEGK